MTPSTVLVALGQAFFSLSIGIGTMVTYASYFKPDTNLRHTALNVTILDTLVAVLAGVVIFRRCSAWASNPRRDRRSYSSPCRASSTRCR